MNVCDGHYEYGVSSDKGHKLTCLQWLVGTFRLSVRKLRHNANIPTVIFVITLVIASYNLHETREVSAKLTRMSSVRGLSSGSQNTEQKKSKQAWVKGKNMETGYLKHVTGVLESVGYTLDGGTYSDWDVLWSHDYPFGNSNPTLKTAIMNLKPHQKVNKWPGSGYVTSKVNLATTGLTHVPKAFQLPQQESLFRSYAKEHPETMWVQKSNNHRGIKITPVSGLDLSRDKTFVQRYVDNPLLIDDRKFDIGVYTIITSIDPLRIYTVDHEFLLRFCPVNYFPFDPENKDKYVVGDNYTPIWEIPSLDKYYSQGFTAKQTFHQYMQDTGADADKVFTDIEDTIREVYLSKLSKMRESLSNYHNRNFFEMVRFDYVLDDKANVYLMEVNMSPNLSSAHFTQNRLLYEQVVYNILHLVGLAGSMQHVSKLEVREQEMLASEKDLSVDPPRCHKLCADGCKPAMCKLCHSCMTQSDKEIYHQAYTEHTNRYNTKRVMPPPMDQQRLEKTPEYFVKLSEQDKMMHHWFAGKCKYDRTWC